MFFDEPDPFEHILERLSALQDRFNQHIQRDK
jgi:hypothetical protein